MLLSPPSTGRERVNEFRWHHAACTDIGRVRAQNEDSLLVVPESGCFAVADGLGGHVAGEVASRLAVDTIAEELGQLTADSGPERARTILEQGIGRANQAILDAVERDPSLSGMGTTLTVLLLSRDGSYSVGHVGDSRAYLFRDRTLRRLTRDHTVVQELVDHGQLTYEQARLHPRSSVLTRALGIDQAVTADLFGGRAESGDRFLLAKDGLTSMIPEEKLQLVLATTPGPGDAATALVEAANDAGGADNITVILLELSSSR